MFSITPGIMGGHAFKVLLTSHAIIIFISHPITSLTAHQPHTPRATLNRLPNPLTQFFFLKFPSGARVARSGSLDSTLTLDITFPPSTSDYPPMRLSSFNPTNGSSPVISITPLQNGSSDLLIAPVTGEWLRLPVAAPGSVWVEALGVPAACADVTGGNCSFSFASEASPTITSLQPTCIGSVEAAQVGGLLLWGVLNRERLRLPVGCCSQRLGGSFGCCGCLH